MEKLTIDAAQIRNYVINNRHNKFTAYYYLLLIKSDKDPKDTI